MRVQLADGARYFQRDARWVGQRLGGSADTVGSAGCAVTSVAMAMTNLGYPIDPGQLSGALTANGGFTGDGWLVWDTVRRLSKRTLRVEVHEAPSLEKLDACLAAGDYPLVKFMLKRGIPHWVLLVGKRDGTYLMRDPLLNEAAPSPLTRRTRVILSVRCIGRVTTLPLRAAEKEETRLMRHAVVVLARCATLARHDVVNAGMVNAAARERFSCDSRGFHAFSGGNLRFKNPVNIIMLRELIMEYDLLGRIFVQVGEFLLYVRLAR